MNLLITDWFEWFWEYKEFFWDGFKITFFISVISIVVGGTLGVIIEYLRSLHVAHYESNMSVRYKKYLSWTKL